MELFMFCVNCGAQNSASARFCHQCGGDLQLPAAPAESGPQAVTVAMLAQKPSVPRQREFVTASSGVKVWQIRPGDSICGGRYTIERELGRGGMGIVYLAKDHMIRGKRFAIKVMADDLAKDANAVEDMKTEVLSAQGLHHPNIVAVYDFVEDDGAVFIKMEHVDGPSLRNLRQSHGRIPPDEVAQWMRQACRGLAYAHEEGVIHLDIKPGNLLLSNSGRVKVADFGLALTLEASRTHKSLKGVFAGTVQYMSPEQFTGHRVSARSDVYSLGATMYSLLAGRAPFRGRNVDFHVINVMPEPLEDAPRWINDLVMRCMAKNEYDRPATMIELERLLGTHNDTLPMPEPSPHLSASTDSLHVAGAGKPTAPTGSSQVLPTLQLPLPPPQSAIPPNSPRPAPAAAPPPSPLSPAHDPHATASVDVPMSAAPAARPGMAGTAPSGHPNGPKKTLHGGNFVLIDEEMFQCPNDLEGERRFRLPVYRFVPFASAVGLTVYERAPDTEFVLVPPSEHTGRYLMGSPAWESNRCDDEWMHPVTIRRPFLIARTQMTQRIYDALAGDHGPWPWMGPLMPAMSVSWADAMQFCQALGLRLPSESEWEFACRAGTQTPFCFGSDLSTSAANYDGNYPYGSAPRGVFREQPIPVGSFPTNAFGLLEVHGNLCEWAADHYTGNYHDAPVDGLPFESAEIAERVIRGGSWDHLAQGCRSAVRNPYDPARRSDLIGFRPAAWATA